MSKTTLEKLSELQYYFIGPTVFDVPEKKFMAMLYEFPVTEHLETDAHELGLRFNKIEHELIGGVLYAGTIEEIVDKAHSREQAVKNSL